MRVLLIDDSSDFHELVRTMLADALPGAELAAYSPVTRGKPAANFPWSRFDVLLLDYKLGSAGDGLEWLREFAPSPGFPPAILVTAHGDPYVAVQAMKNGAEDYLDKKDINARRLADTIREVTANRTLRTASLASGDVAATRPGLSNTATIAPADLGIEPPERVDIRGYDILKLIGEGATAKVYLARRIKDDLNLVLKLMDPILLQDNEFLTRFLLEAELVLEIDSPHVVKIYEQAFTDLGGFIAMEYLPRGDLRRKIARKVSPENAVDYFSQIVGGLDAIHQVGIVHRDLKPANIMFRRDGTLAIVDFGISQRMDDRGDLTVAGAVLGTPYYISPEQGRGESIDYRSDLYSAGIIFYEMLTGAKPYVGDSPAALVYQHIYGDLPQLPPALERYQRFLDKMLAKSPGGRHENLAAVLDELRAI